MLITITQAPPLPRLGVRVCLCLLEGLFRVQQDIFRVATLGVYKAITGSARGLTWSFLAVALGCFSSGQCLCLALCGGLMRLKVDYPD